MTLKNRQQQDVNKYLQERQQQLATFIQTPPFNEGPCSQFLPGTESYEFCCALNPGACGNQPAELLYYYHPDHLGSSTAITDKHAKPYQFFLNLPFGETFVEQNTYGPLDNQYKFNGKELDTETGLYYYGARFYDPRVSFWYSPRRTHGVDPLAQKYPGFSPYNYVFNNPVINTDPTGRSVNGEFERDKNGK